MDLQKMERKIEREADKRFMEEKVQRMRRGLEERIEKASLQQHILALRRDVTQMQMRMHMHPQPQPSLPLPSADQSVLPRARGRAEFERREAQLLQEKEEWLAQMRKQGNVMEHAPVNRSTPLISIATAW